MRKWRLREVKEFAQVAELNRERARMYPKLPRKWSVS